MSLVVTALRGKRVPVLWALLFLGLAGLNAAVLLRGDAGSQASQTSGSSHAPPPPAQINTRRGEPTAKSSGSSGGDSSPQAPGHVVVCSDPVWDFGTVDQTKTRELSHTFSVENVSNRAVKIERVEGCCGLVVARDCPAEIAPNSRADFGVSINLAGPPRPVRKVMTIHLGPPDLGKLALAVRGVIDASPTFYSTPSTLDFGTLGPSDRPIRRVKIARFDGSRVNFLQAIPQFDALSVDDAVGGDDADSFVELTLSLDGSRLRAGDFESSVTIQTAHSTFSEFVIPVKARIAGAPNTLVRSIFAGNLRRGIAQVKPLSSRGAAAEIEHLSFEGQAPIAIELIVSEVGAPRAAPMLRIARTDKEASAAKPRVLRGHLIVKLVARATPVRIPMFIQLTD